VVNQKRKKAEKQITAKEIGKELEETIK
jgi:hypothetical protein